MRDDEANTTAAPIAPRSFFRAAYIYGGLTEEQYANAFRAAYNDGLLATDSGHPENYWRRQIRHYNEEPHRYTAAGYKQRPAESNKD